MGGRPGAPALRNMRVRQLAAAPSPSAPLVSHPRLRRCRASSAWQTTWLTPRWTRPRRASGTALRCRPRARAAGWRKGSPARPPRPVSAAACKPRSACLRGLVCLCRGCCRVPRLALTPRPLRPTPRRRHPRHPGRGAQRVRPHALPPQRPGQPGAKGCACALLARLRSGCPPLAAGAAACACCGGSTRPDHATPHHTNQYRRPSRPRRSTLRASTLTLVTRRRWRGAWWSWTNPASTTSLSSTCVHAFVHACGVLACIASQGPDPHPTWLVCRSASPTPHPCRPPPALPHPAALAQAVQLAMDRKARERELMSVLLPDLVPRVVSEDQVRASLRGLV